MLTAEIEPDQAAEAVTISGNVDPSTGDIESQGDVIVRGNVTDAHVVRSAAGVMISGSVDAAEVHAAADIVVGGGAVGKNKCRCIAGRDLTVRHVNGAALEAGRNITVQSNAAQARLICGGHLDVSAGSLGGGHATAAGGVVCKSIGSSSGSATLVEAGIDESLRRLALERLPQLEAQIAQLEKLRTAAAPLVRNQKGLTPQEKEKATELLYEIQELEESVHDSVAELRRRHEQVQEQAQPEITVSDTLHAGVTIRIGALESHVQAAMKGPLVITQRRVGASSCIVMIEPDTGACRPLTTVPFRDAALERLNRILIIKE
jgi:uncharacterized protein (DUF342 family)